MLKEIYSETGKKMDASISRLKKDLSGVRTGRASLSIFDGVMVEYYGTPTPLNQVAGLTSPEANLIVIQPWEASTIPHIEKAILAANIGLTPSSDGAVIRITVPQLTEERRKEYVKLSHKHGETCKTAIRNIRRDSNDQLKKIEKSKDISQDEMHTGFDEVQKITDGKIKIVDELVAVKEKDIMTI